MKSVDSVQELAKKNQERVTTAQSSRREAELAMQKAKDEEQQLQAELLRAQEIDRQKKETEAKSEQTEQKVNELGGG